jgi:hypothetical protein
VRSNVTDCVKVVPDLGLSRMAGEALYFIYKFEGCGRLVGDAGSPTVGISCSAIRVRGRSFAFVYSEGNAHASTRPVKPSEAGHRTCWGGGSELVGHCRRSLTGGANIMLNQLRCCTLPVCASSAAAADPSTRSVAADQLRAEYMPKVVVRSEFRSVQQPWMTNISAAGEDHT